MTNEPDLPDDLSPPDDYSRPASPSSSRSESAVEEDPFSLLAPSPQSSFSSRSSPFRSDDHHSIDEHSDSGFSSPKSEAEKLAVTEIDLSQADPDYIKGMDREYKTEQGESAARNDTVAASKLFLDLQRAPVEAVDFRIESVHSMGNRFPKGIDEADMERGLENFISLLAKHAHADSSQSKAVWKRGLLALSQTVFNAPAALITKAINSPNDPAYVPPKLETRSWQITAHVVDGHVSHLSSESEFAIQRLRKADPELPSIEGDLGEGRIHLSVEMPETVDDTTRLNLGVKEIVLAPTLKLYEGTSLGNKPYAQEVKRSLDMKQAPMDPLHKRSHVLTHLFMSLSEPTPLHAGRLARQNSVPNLGESLKNKFSRRTPTG